MKKLLPLMLSLFIAPAFAHSDHAHDDSVSKPPKRAASRTTAAPKTTPAPVVKKAKPVTPVASTRDAKLP